MLDFWAKGADGVTVRRVTDFVVVFKMAGGLPSLARVATGLELRNVFIVAVLLERRRGFPLCVRGCRRVRSLGRRGGGAPAGLPLKGAAGSCAPRNRVRWALGGHNERRAGLLRAS